VTSGKLRLAFVSPVFLFPNDAGGKIRTTNILRGMKGGAFDITMIGPGTAEQRRKWHAQIESVCDAFVGWEPAPVPQRWRRAFGLVGALPVNVRVDRSRVALEAVDRALRAAHFDIVVFDFVHAAVLRPAGLAAKTLCFTHNVEAEIFDRHATRASNAPMRWVWASQHRKMERFERDALRRFDAVVAVSERDARYFREHYGIADPDVIPTGVDLEFFDWRARPQRAASQAPTVVFTGVMDWAANIDGVEFFLASVWPRVRARLPTAEFFVVGRNPQAALVDLAQRTPGVTVTGSVDDVRPFVLKADVFVIPLRVGGGTRIKAFEAMAMGCPVVSTAIGIEGLELVAGDQYLLADEATAFADAVIRVLEDGHLGATLAARARGHVESKFGHDVAARAFERACLRALPHGSVAATT
jgi:glycosyltransferase involved in cell wall biosynthesis